MCMHIYWHNEHLLYVCTWKEYSWNLCCIGIQCMDQCTYVCVWSWVHQVQDMLVGLPFEGPCLVCPGEWGSVTSVMAIPQPWCNTAWSVDLSKVIVFQSSSLPTQVVSSYPDCYWFTYLHVKLSTTSSLHTYIIGAVQCYICTYTYTYVRT